MIPIFRHTVKCLLFLIVIGILSSSPCYASIAGGYLSILPGEITYLRLTQMGAHLDGSMQTVEADAQSARGFRVMQNNIQGTINGHSIAIRMDGLLGIRSPLLDGTCQKSNISLRFPSSEGQLVKLVFRRASALTWNQTVATFETKQGRLAYLRRLAYDYQAANGQYFSAKNRLALDHHALQSAIDSQNKAQEKVNKIQQALDQAKQVYEQAKANAVLRPAPDDHLTGDDYMKAFGEYEKASQTASDAEYKVNLIKNDLDGFNFNLQMAQTRVSEAKANIQQETDTISAAWYRANQDAQQARRVAALLHPQAASINANMKNRH